MNAQDFITEILLKAGGGLTLPKMAEQMRIVDNQPKNETNGAFWEHKGSARLVGGGKISVKYLTGPGTPANPVWTITKPNGEKTVIHGLGIKDGKPSGIDSRGHGKYTATITKPNGEVETLRQNGSEGTRALHTALAEVSPKPTGGKHPFHGNQYTSHGTEVPVKGKKPTTKAVDFSIGELAKGFHDKPDKNPYLDIARMGKPHQQWSDKSGNHFVYRKDGVDTHYLISPNKFGDPQMSLVSRTPASQRYQVSTNRQSRQATTTPSGGEHKFHGNQFTSHGSDVPVKGQQPKTKSFDFSTNALLKGN